jgi:DNA polymerase-1
MQREFGKRVAMNAPIQGTAADIMKIAMINVRDVLKKNNLTSEILIQVHDELLLEIKTSEKEEVVKILQTEMENAYKLSVPLSVDLNVGENWYEAK